MTYLKAPRPDRCDASARCRRPATIYVTQMSWRSQACEVHVGVLITRRLSGGVSGVPTTVSLRADVAEAAAEAAAKPNGERDG